MWPTAAKSRAIPYVSSVIALYITVEKRERATPRSENEPAAHLPESQLLDTSVWAHAGARRGGRAALPLGSARKDMAGGLVAHAESAQVPCMLRTSRKAKQKQLNCFKNTQSF